MRSLSVHCPPPQRELKHAPAWREDDAAAPAGGGAAAGTAAVALLPACIEKFAALRTYATAFAVTPAAKHRDESLRLRCAALRSFVSPAHLDLPDECDAPESAPHWELACFHLTELNRYRAPVDKCTCLTNACLLLSGMMAALKARRSAVAAVTAAAPSESDGDAETLQGDGALLPVGLRSPGARPAHDGPVAAAAASGADDLLPALVLALLRSNPAHLASNVEYIRDYHAPDALRSEAGYYLTHVESAVAFLEGLSASHLTGVTAAEFEAVLTGASPHREGGSEQTASNAAPAVLVVAQTLQGNLREEEGVVESETPNDEDSLSATPQGGAEDSRSVSVAIRGAMAQLETAAIPLPPVHTAGTEVAVAPLDDAEGSALDEDLCGSRLPSRLLVLSPEELLGVLEPPPARGTADSAADATGTGSSRGVGAADAIAGWLQQRLRFLQVHSAADLRLADLQPLLDEYRA